MEWSKVDTIKFIELWQGFPCLWNTKCTEYKNRIKRRDSLLQLAEQMGLDSVNPIEKKITSLKTQFNRELNKLKTKSGAGLDEVGQSSWYAFNHLQFIKDINVPVPSTDSIAVLTQVTEQEVDLLEENENNRSESVTPQQHQTRSIYNKRTEPGTLNYEIDGLECLTPQGSQTKSNKRKHESESGTLNILRDASNAIISKQKKDEFSIFGESIASELREIKSKRHLLMLKKQIMDLVFKTKIEILDSETNIKENIGPLGSVPLEVEVEVMDELYADTTTSDHNYNCNSNFT